MKQTTTTTAEAIAPILQSYINVCGITQYVEPTARDFSVVEKIKCDLRICNLLSGRKTAQIRRSRIYRFRREILRLAFSRTRAGFDILRYAKRRKKNI